MQWNGISQSIEITDFELYFKLYNLNKLEKNTNIIKKLY